MGNTESYQEEANDMSQFDGVETLGYRVLGVQPNSPASQAGLVSFFDFLVGVNGQLIFGVSGGNHNGENNGSQNQGGDDEDEFYEDVDFPALLKGSINQEVELLVWNIKSQSQRFINLTPTTSWGGTGLLGVTIRVDNYATAEENLLRVLSIDKSSSTTSASLSPAAMAGLTAQTDYLLGTTLESFESEDTLASVLEENQDKVLEVYVYNTESDVVRVVTLVPTLSWGGRGLLGAEVGRGYLHRLPKACRGTLGISFERRVTTMTPSVPMINEGDNSENGVASDVGLNNAAVEDHSLELKNENEGEDPGQQVVEDLSQLTCGVSGQVVHLAPQMEMEQVPIRSSSLEDQPIDQTAIGKDLTETVDEKNDQLTPPPQQQEQQSIQSEETMKDAAKVDSPTELVSPTNSLPPMPELQNGAASNNTDANLGADDDSSNNDGAAFLDLPPPPFSQIVEQEKDDEDINLR